MPTSLQALTYSNNGFGKESVHAISQLLHWNLRIGKARSLK